MAPTKAVSGNNRRAYTLAELVISMAAATVLMLGLASSMFLVIETFESQPVVVTSTRAAEVQASMMRDLERATSFLQMSKEIAEFTLPDEDGDGVEETVKYEHDKDNDLLLFTLNGVTTTLLTDVDNADFEFFERDVVGSAAEPVAYDEDLWGTRWRGQVVLEEVTEAGAQDVTTLNLPTPAGTEEGDLLIAVVVADKNETPVPPSGEGWTFVDVQLHGDTALMLAVLWKLADSSEPSSHGFSIVDDEDMYGFLMRFTGHDPAAPINASSGFTEGNSSEPSSPAVTTTVDDAIILRIGGFDDKDVTVGDPGLKDHTVILMNSSAPSGTTCSGGAGYVVQEDAGSSGTSKFKLTATEQYLTITLAIAPE